MKPQADDEARRCTNVGASSRAPPTLPHPHGRNLDANQGDAGSPKGGSPTSRPAYGQRTVYVCRHEGSGFHPMERMGGIWGDMRRTYGNSCAQGRPHVWSVGGAYVSSEVAGRVSEARAWIPSVADAPNGCTQEASAEPT
jgi:hypothetical protein